MLAETRFRNKPLEFWAYVRLISQRLGYYQEAGEEEGEPSEEGPRGVITVESGSTDTAEVEAASSVYVGAVNIEDVVRCLTSVRVRLGVKFRLTDSPVEGLSYDPATKDLTLVGPLSAEQQATLLEDLADGGRAGWNKAITNLYRLARGLPAVDTSELVSGDRPTPLGREIVDYLNFRLGALRRIQPNLMEKAEAEKLFNDLKAELEPECLLPMNKQKGEKRHHAYLTGIINMLTERELGGVFFDDNPRGLTTLTRAGKPFRTLSRWLDGAYPGINDPTAIWEVKEYYGTTSFGSRVADGVYESMLDGMELEEAAGHLPRVRHYLIVDDRFTWWTKGKSYLCRLIDILHMGLVDEILFGREALDRWPVIVRSWPQPTR